MHRLELHSLSAAHPLPSGCRASQTPPRHSPEPQSVSRVHEAPPKSAAPHAPFTQVEESTFADPKLKDSPEGPGCDAVPRIASKTQCPDTHAPEEQASSRVHGGPWVGSCATPHWPASQTPDSQSDASSQRFSEPHEGTNNAAQTIASPAENVRTRSPHCPVEEQSVCPAGVALSGAKPSRGSPSLPRCARASAAHRTAAEVDAVSVSDLTLGGQLSHMRPP
jgi:hypothetical protein